MWPFKKKKIKHRRLEVRKDISSDVPSLWERFRTTGMMVSVLLGLGFWISAGLLDICPLDPLPYRQGQYLPGNVRARVAFEVPSPTRMEDQLRLAREATPATFVLDERRINAIVSSVQSLPGKLKTTTQPSSLEKELRESFALDDTTLAAWKAMFEELHRDKLNAITKSLKTDLTKLAVVSGDQAEQQMSRHTGGVILKGNDWSRLIEKSELIAQDDEVRVSAAAERLAKGATEGVLADSLKVFLSRQLTTNPLYSYDSEVTEADIALREKETRDNPPLAAKDRYEPGQILVERTVSSGRAGAPLEARELELLAHEHRAWLNEGSTAGLWARAIGRMIQILMVTVLLSVYIAKYQGRIVSNHLRGIAVVIVLLLMLAMSRIMGSLLDWNPYASVLTVVMISCVMAITYNQRFAMAIGSVQAVLVTMQLRGDFGMLIVMLSGVMPCVFLLRDIRTRSKLIEVSAISAAVVFLAVWVRSWTGQAPWNFAMVDGLWASGFALLAGFLVQGILPLIERAFKVATSMTLLEWCDASKPLLKRLATQAPGTYNHSLQLGMMCESAAEAIGARGLLARVGAYYHDIGKTRKPEYFVENQGTMPSKHENLSPAMSLLIIVGHVKDGIEMAKECNLPTVLHEFIITHHGTTLVHHFYEEAARQRTADSDRAPDEVEFRYPGPKPSSKESGILMLADVAESSVRSMEEPTPVRIESQVHSMVQRRLMDGQLDHCNLTLREVHAIEMSLVKSLCGIYHARIAYPTPSGEKPAAAELPSPNGRNGNGNDQKAAEKKPDNTPQPEDATPQSNDTEQDVSQDADS